MANITPTRGPPDIRKEHALETYKSLTTTGVEAVKTALLLNGAAAVAFITFLGNLLAKQTPMGSSLPDLKPALRLYLIGVIVAGIALILGYLINLRVYNEVIRQLPERHRWLLWPAIVLVVASYGFFVAGSVLASRALSSML